MQDNRIQKMWEITEQRIGDMSCTTTNPNTTLRVITKGRWIINYFIQDQKGLQIWQQLLNSQKQLMINSTKLFIGTACFKDTFAYSSKKEPNHTKHTETCGNALQKPFKELDYKSDKSL